jgi:hypothetical protein
MTARWLTSWGPLLVLTGALALFESAYVAFQVPPSPLAATIMVYSVPLYLAFWVLMDARLRRCVPCMDFGLFVYMAFPLSIAWYVLWSRRLRGLLILGAFTGLYLAPWLVAVFVWIALTVLHGL